MKKVTDLELEGLLDQLNSVAIGYDGEGFGLPLHRPALRAEMLDILRTGLTPGRVVDRWMVVTKDGEVCGSSEDSLKGARSWARELDDWYPHAAPHRIMDVCLTPHE
jgi:hypothetical protein